MWSASLDARSFAHQSVIMLTPNWLAMPVSVSPARTWYVVRRSFASGTLVSTATGLRSVPSARYAPDGAGLVASPVPAAAPLPPAGPLPAGPLPAASPVPTAGSVVAAGSLAKPSVLPVPVTSPTPVLASLAPVPSIVPALRS